MNQYYAKVAKGLEAIAAQELESLGAENVCPEFTGVSFTGDKTLLYRVNIWARTIFRVLVPIAEIRCVNREVLYKEVKKIPWQRYLSPKNTLAVNCTGSNDKLKHTHYTALQIKDAITEQQIEKFRYRSNIDTKNPDILINAHIQNNNCILSLDSSGSSLHQRGYRLAMGFAPLKETLAAAILEMAEYSPDIPFLDPLCGSGTLPLEASLKALNIAPGLLRNKFSLMNWRDFDKSLWQDLLTEAKNSQLTELKSIIVGSDRNPEVLFQARINSERCGVANKIKFIKTDLSKLKPPADKGIIICNPPYGERLGEVEELGELYKMLGDIFKQRFTGWTAFILTGSKQLSKQVGLRTSRRIPVYNGAIPCTLLKYELY
ncbi:MULTISPECIES: class I SAM-dependent RNA methyltransferase [unclassified Okeania]|uniref:THUMP domain-containing class I SAM-dependent RNA methyltransferase n=1 Tax=unclassified Okeania TaxID=2634635 RepID=UPI0013BB21E0|nr:MULTISPECIES: THUMP domain-containing protein [unclassified Okeania]NES76309.1 RNA methyltransferase [Okeania sp. SIO1H4]NET12184.1 RNA methyltransferase [Okeania sp. SIO1H6]NET19754.1 RNA methyltransferase [Okeania sp. SIO1H5]NET96351.1 RNA methyltransferase [Okeania sp. SIO1H2]